MPTVSLSGVYSAQFFTDTGTLAAGYRLYTYAPSTTTKKVAYTESTGSTAHTYVSDGAGGEYIALNARGELPAPLFLASGGYDLCLKTALGVTVWTRRATATVNSALIEYDPTQAYTSGLGQFLNYTHARTAAEIAAGVTPANYAYPPGDVRRYGAVGDGTTNDTQAILDALSALSSGGSVYFPAGTYKFLRGNGSLLTDTIPASNVLIYGDGAASVISGYKGTGVIADDVGNEYYNVFQATSLSGITIKDISFEGYTTPISLWSCSDVLVSNIRDDGQLANTTKYMRDKSVYLDKCTSVRVSDSYFLNNFFGVYLSGDVTTRSNLITISGNHFEHITAAGNYTATFPASIYNYYAGSVTITGNTFKNIYSSVDSGNQGTGIGYAIYDGDGDTVQLNIVGNTFDFEAKGLKRAICVLGTTLDVMNVTGNTFQIGGSACVAAGIWLQPITKNTTHVVSGNTFQWASDAGVFGPCIQLYASDLATTLAPTFNITGNNCRGGGWGVRNVAYGRGKFSISNNVFTEQTGPAIQFDGQDTVPHQLVSISGNYISGCGTNGILLNGYCTRTSIIGNTILDGNTTEAAGSAGAAIYAPSYSYGMFVKNNVIGNTSTAGKFTYSVSAVSADTVRIFKTIIGDNSLLNCGFENTTVINNAAPATSFLDIEECDFVPNNNLAAGRVPGWYCANVIRQTLTANASSASTTVTVGDTTGMLAGDAVLLVKTADPGSDGSYVSGDNWHADTVASVTDGTRFVLTSGIAAGDGTYSSGTALAVVARFKAAAAIAS